MNREQYVAELTRIEANVRAIHERQQKRMEEFVRESRSFTHDMLDHIERLKAQAVVS